MLPSSKITRLKTQNYCDRRLVADAFTAHFSTPCGGVGIGGSQLTAATFASVFGDTALTAVQVRHLRNQGTTAGAVAYGGKAIGGGTWCTFHMFSF